MSNSEVNMVLNALAQKFGVTVNWNSETLIPYMQQLCDKCVKYELTKKHYSPNVWNYLHNNRFRGN